MRQRNFQSLRKVSGLSLLELVLALNLSLLLLGLLSGVYWTLGEQQRKLQALLRLQDNSRLALEKLSQEIALAGFIGCMRLAQPLRLDSGGELTVRHRSGEASRLAAEMDRQDELVLTDELPLRPGMVLLISDCKKAEIFQVAWVEKSGLGQVKIRSLQPLTNTYEPGTEVGYWEVNHYSVEKTGRLDKKGRSLLSLYERDMQGHKTEWIEGIQQLAFDAEGKGISIQVEAREDFLSRKCFGFAVIGSGIIRSKP